MEKLLMELATNLIIELVVIAVVMDTIFGAGRAIKYRCFNSSVGIDGAIRKISRAWKYARKHINSIYSVT